MARLVSHRGGELQYMMSTTEVTASGGDAAILASISDNGRNLVLIVVKVCCVQQPPCLDSYTAVIACGRTRRRQLM